MKKFTLLTLLVVLSMAGAMAQTITTTLLGRYTDGSEGACEISAYDMNSQRIFITNANNQSLDIVMCPMYLHRASSSR